MWLTYVLGFAIIPMGIGFACGKVADTINEALQYYNRIQKKNITAKLLETESKLVQAESLKVLAEFENLDEYDY